MENTPLDASLFATTIVGLTQAFGDSTRREIYFAVREAGHITVGEIAEKVGVHANVVRHHLNALTTSGHVTLSDERRGGRGRPATTYTVAGELAIEGTLRRDALLVALLEKTLALLGPEAAEAAAQEVGFTYGQGLAASAATTDDNVSVQEAMAGMAGLLTAHGFATRFETDDVSASLVTDHCPFGTAPQHHPVLCAVDRGLVAGMLEGLGVKTSRVTLSSRARGDDDCRITA